MPRQRVTIPVFQLGCGGGGALTIERALARLPGVVRIYVNPATEMAYLEVDSSLITLEGVKATVEQLGFRAGDVTFH